MVILLVYLHREDKLKNRIVTLKDILTPNNLPSCTIIWLVTHALRLDMVAETSDVLLFFFAAAAKKAYGTAYGSKLLLIHPIHRRT